MSSRAIRADDRPALSSAFSGSDDTLESEARRERARTPVPGDMKNKIDSLIANEVSGRKLTSAQADELKNVFVQTFKNDRSRHTARAGRRSGHN